MTMALLICISRLRTMSTIIGRFTQCFLHHIIDLRASFGVVTSQHAEYPQQINLYPWGWYLVVIVLLRVFVQYNVFENTAEVIRHVFVGFRILCDEPFHESDCNECYRWLLIKQRLLQVCLIGYEYLRLYIMDLLQGY
jgi:hypothetical protein